MRNNKKDINNRTYRLFKETSNKIEIVSPGVNKEAADKKGRGATCNFLWWDEFVFIKYIAEFYESATMAHSEASIKAKKNNKPYAKMITTTPNMADLPEGAYGLDMIANAAKFIEPIYDMTLDEIEMYLEYNSSNDFFYIEYSYLELGRVTNYN